MQRVATHPLRARLQGRLEALATQGLTRRLHAAEGIDFTSNDYLGFARHPALRKFFLTRLAAAATDPFGAPASRLLRGHTTSHAALETRLAAFKGTEAALLLPSGYMANLALLTAVIEPGDRVLSDAQNHASIIDALRLTGCHKVIVPHLDRAALAAQLATPHAGHTFIVTESLFSMDGDIAPLGIYADLADAHGASLIIDDSHGTGVFGATRRSGVTEADNVAGRALAIVSTFGKALACAGACIAGPTVLIDFLVNRARPFIFTTALAPLLVHAIEAGLDVLAATPDAAPRVLARAALLRQLLQEQASRDVTLLAGAGPIVPVILGDNHRAMLVAHKVREAGYDVRAVRPPTVAPGTARLRICVHADHSVAQIHGVAQAIVAAVAAT